MALDIQQDVDISKIREARGWICRLSTTGRGFSAVLCYARTCKWISTQTPERI